MERKARSLRGELVNFDLFAIKEQMSEAPITTTIKQREKFIDMRKRRGTRKILNNIVSEMEAEAVQEEAEELGEESEQTLPTSAAAPKRKIVKNKAD